MQSSAEIDPRITPDLIAQELARRELIEFVEYTFPGYQAGWFSRELAAELERFLADCVAGKSPRLIISAPPRHGKSELVSRRFPAWVLGRNPDLFVIAASYSATLAGRMSRDVDRIVGSSEYAEAFPDTKFPRKGLDNPEGKVSQVELREVIGHTGSYRAAGVGEGITGSGGQVIIIDDPVKDAKEANSATVREAIWEWYTSTAYTRLEPGGGMLIVMTRWHADDLVGRLLEAMRKGEGDTFRVVEYPAVAEKDEKHRKVGQALDPKRYPLQRLKAIAKAVGSYVWSALYQQRPSVKGGSVFKGEWWAYWRALPVIRWRAIYGDTAQKTKERNDYSVFQCWGYGADGRIYLLDQIRGKWEAPELEKHAVAFWLKHKGPDKQHITTRKMAVEDKASGTGLIQSLKRRKGIPIVGIPRSIDKVTRAMDGAPQIEAGNVVLPAEAEWLSDYLMEFEAFTMDDSHAFDDQVDTTLDAIQDMLGGVVDLYGQGVR